MLWNTRNNLVFNNKMIKEPKVVVVLFKLVALLQNWTVMVSEKDKERVVELIRHMVNGIDQI